MLRIAIAIALCGSALVHAQPPALPQFVIATATGKTTFFMGERIPLVLSYSGPADTYEISLFNFGRGDPLGLDTFEITPADGWSDSLAAYFAFSSFGCCGQKQSGALSAKPTSLNVNLNEWARFDEPGTYTISVVSHRVTIAPHGRFKSPVPIDTRSNSLQLHIVVPTPAWQRATLANSVRVLSQPHEMYAETSPERNAALGDLRYLGTVQAIPALAANVRDDRPDLKQDAVEGLIGLSSPKREVALAAMNHLIDDPAFPISADFLNAIPLLHLEGERLPNHEMSSQEVEALLNAHEIRVEPFASAAWERVAEALPRKIEPARAVTAQTLVALAPDNPSPSANAQIGEILRKSFPTLSREEKARLLTDSWDKLGSRALLPQLISLATSPPDDTDSFSLLSIRAIALERWFEFEPENATREILRQIGSATPALMASEIDYLPERSLPQFEMLWANAFNEADTNDSSTCDHLGALLVRFGTGAAAPGFAAKLRDPNGYTLGNCSSLAFAYLVKFDPKIAKDLITEGNGVPPANLFFVSKIVQNPLLTEAALRELDDDRISVVSDALQYLRNFGDESVRQPILDHYLKSEEIWSARPSGSEDEDETPEERERSSLRRVFIEALLTNQGWIAGPALQATVQQHCIGKDLCQEVEQLLQPNFKVHVISWSHNIEYGVGNVEMIPSLGLFEAKLDQYPKGTTFTLSRVSTGSPAAQRKLEAALSSILEKHEMKLDSH